jgi:hypothetical protein
MARNDESINIIVKGKDLASGPLGKVNKSLGKLDKGAGGLRGRLKGLTGGLDLFGSALLGPIGIIGGLTAGLGLAAKMAAEEQVGIERLNKALDANVKGWDGNRDAIEEVIRQREKLAFADDDLRYSLATLVTRTHDVNEAMDLQQKAMDLARLKGIDLATASDIVGKVYSGNVGILTRYGIAVEKGSTATEALAAIQKQAGGQAEAYGQTTQGAFESAQIAMGDVVEDIGVAVLPAMTSIAFFVRDSLIPAIRTVVGVIGDWIGKFQKLVQWLDTSTPIIHLMRAYIDFLAAAFRRVAATIGVTINQIASLIRWAQQAIAVMEQLGRVVSLSPGGIAQGIMGRQHGGPMLPGGKYLVGEGGRAETAYMFPHGGGYVVPGGTTGSGRSGPTVIHTHIYLDGREITRAVEKRLALDYVTAPITTRAT